MMGQMQLLAKRCPNGCTRRAKMDSRSNFVAVIIRIHQISSSNKQIWDRSGIKLDLFIENVQPIWDVLAREIWPIFAPNIRHLNFYDGDHLGNLRRLISPTILTDLDQLDSTNFDYLFLNEISYDVPNATSAGQALSKWLHTPTKTGQPKRLFCMDFEQEVNLDWVNSFKEAFLRATTSVAYNVWLIFYKTTRPIEPFELENERTNEKLTLSRESYVVWLLKRCPIIAEAATVQLENDENLDNLNGVYFTLHRNCIGLLSPPTDFPGPSDQRKMKK